MKFLFILPRRTGSHSLLTVVSRRASNNRRYSNPVRAAEKMVDKYDFRFFKYDGISAQFSSVGLNPSTVGEENAEAIINIERDIRKKKDDIFINTNVGTWASPFWFHFTDAVWRQESDYGTTGNHLPPPKVRKKVM